MNKSLVSPPSQFLFFFLVFITSCFGQYQTESLKDRVSVNGDKDSGKWRIVDVHHLWLGDITYRFFFKDKNLVLIDEEGKQYELVKQDAEGSDLQSILNSNTLISPFVRKIFQDKSGNLWFPWH